MKKLLLALLLLPAGAFAGRVIERETACPVCGKAFYAELELNSGSDGALRLDLRHGEEPPARLPDCPQCGFVVYKAGFGRAEAAAAKAVVYGTDYRKALKRGSYYRAGLLFSRLAKPPFSVANQFLKASWQEETDPALVAEDQALALRWYTEAVDKDTERDEEWEKANLLRGELLRRLGRFEECSDHFNSIKSDRAFQNKLLSQIVTYQLGLCAIRDPDPHFLSEVGSPVKKRPAWLRRLRARFSGMFDK